MEVPHLQSFNFANYLPAQNQKSSLATFLFGAMTLCMYMTTIYFFQEYRHFFDNGIQNNLRKGPLDIYGVNYFAPVLVDPIIDQILCEKPKEYEILVSWLTDAKKYNGFYILGL